jgi:hypothetical protein
MIDKIDDRTKSLPFFSLLEKMFKEQIIRPAEVEKFEKTLQEHQRAMTGPSGKQKTVNNESTTTRHPPFILISRDMVYG